MKNENSRIRAFVKIIESIEEMSNESRDFEKEISSLFIDFQGFLKISQKFEVEMIKIGAELFSDNDDDLPLNIDWIEWYLYRKPKKSDSDFNVKINCKKFDIQTPEDLGLLLKYINENQQ